LQILLDEEQAIRYLVKYASKPEKSSHHVSELLRSLVPNNVSVDDRENDAADEESIEEETPSTTAVSGPTLIRRVALKSVGERNKSKQEVMHLLLQEKLYNSDFVYVNVHLDKHDVRILKESEPLPPQAIDNDENSPQSSRAFYCNIFDLYAERSNEEDQNLSFLKFCRKYNVENGKLIIRSKRTVVLAFPSRSSNPTSKFYYQYCKYFLVKHKVWSGHVSNAWSAPIYDDDGQIELTDDNHSVVQKWYITKFNEFRAVNDISKLEMINADVNGLRRIRNECEILYNEEEEALGDQIGAQDGWMLIAGMGPLFNDSSVPDDLAPSFDANVDWINVRKTPDNLVDIAPNHLQLARQNENASRHIEDIDLSILNKHQKFASDIVLSSSFSQ